jgi:hypothetical protein
MRYTNLYILFSILVGVSGWSGDMPGAPEAPTSSSSYVGAAGAGGDGGDGTIASPLSQKEQVVENGRLVRAAAEAFAARNDGWYPTNLIDKNRDGVRLVDLLPGGQLLVNPVTGARNLPIDGAATGSGETGYLALVVDDRIPKGYWIKGNGQSGVKIADIKRSIDGAVSESTGRLSPTLDDLVLENCRLVGLAADAYASQHGGDYTRRVSDLRVYLPQAVFLTNPSTGAATEPVEWWEPDGPGSTAYNLLRERNEDYTQPVVGYRIVGRGEHGDFVVSNAPVVINKEQIVVRNCLAVGNAADAWAADNGGDYPHNLSHVNSLGNNMYDYLPGGRLMENPFSRAATEPVMGSAASAGSTGYMAWDVDGNGTADTCYIDGIGSSAEYVIYARLYGD